MEEKSTWLGERGELGFGVTLFLWSACSPTFLSQAQSRSDPPPEPVPPEPGARVCAETAAPPNSAPRRGEGLNKRLLCPDRPSFHCSLSQPRLGGNPITIPPFSRSVTIWGAEVE